MAGGYNYIQNQAATPGAPTEGQTWFAPDTGNTYVYHLGSWVLTVSNVIDGGTASSTF